MLDPTLHKPILYSEEGIASPDVSDSSTQTRLPDALSSEIEYHEDNPLVLVGARDNSSGAVLKGTLVLCLSEPLKASRCTISTSSEAKNGSMRSPDLYPFYLIQ